MKKIREILRLRFECQCSYEVIARSIGVGATTVGDCLARAHKANISWPLPEGLTDLQLEASLYPPRALPPASKEQKSLIDWPTLYKETKRKGVTLMLLWEESKQRTPQGVNYSQFCNLYRAWREH